MSSISPELQFSEKHIDIKSQGFINKKVLDKKHDGNENENDIDSYTEYELGDEKPFSAFNDIVHLSERHSKFDDNLCKVLNGNGDTETEVGPESTDSSTDNFDNDGFELEEDTDCK